MESGEKVGGLAQAEAAVRVPHIREVILENFMSHEYSRIPLKPGVNLITGPNGSGKSSILLGIAVALGQTYTDRSERLSDLIRRGEKAARVSVIFDNTEIGGKRPIPWLDSDQLVVTRYLKRTGDYWHYVNNRFKSKAEVEHLLKKLGINPNNMLIIMHQNMIEQFAAKSSVEKLRMVEDAVGASHFRERIMEAERRLRDLQAQERGLKRALEEAKAAVEYWREEYERLVMRRKLEEERRRLELELAWAEVQEKEAQVGRIEERIEALKIEEKKLEAEAEFHEAEAERLRAELISMYESRIGSLEEFGKKLDMLLDEKVSEGVARYRLKLNEAEARRLGYELKKLRNELEEKVRRASAIGERVETSRRSQEIAEDLKALTLKIASLGEVAEEAEDMYLVADARYRETEAKAAEAEENLRKALEEVEYRKELWRNFLRELVSEVEPRFNEILGHADGAGRIVLRNLEDPEKASLELYVGFRGVEPALLDAHTHSGGERIVGTLAFLLALQKYVKSPFRAVDEFDVHLDPLNRERMVKLLLASAKTEQTVQYIIITPGKIPVEAGMHILVVQNVGGRSQVRRYSR